MSIGKERKHLATTIRWMRPAVKEEEKNHSIIPTHPSPAEIIESINYGNPIPHHQITNSTNHQLRAHTRLTNCLPLDHLCLFSSFVKIVLHIVNSS